MGVRSSVQPQFDLAHSLGSLADPNRYHDAIDVSPDDYGWLVSALRAMLLARAVEEKIGEMVASGVVRCPCHLAIGQEAAAVGIARYLRSSDRVFGAHRSHAHFIALGGSVRGLFAEVQGRATGVSGGMGGSMHLIDRSRGLYGTVPIVAATIPMAVGAGLAAKMDGKQDVAVSFFGDGATEEGAFHESMNLAATLLLPVLFVCENNLFSSHLHIDLRQPANSVSRYAEAHRVQWTRMDGNDVVSVSKKAGEAIAAMRSGGGPQFLELVTYRWRGHVGPRDDEDVGVKRKDDLAEWKQRDPIARAAAALLHSERVDEAEINSMREQIHREVEQAWSQSSRDPYPAPTALLDHVYSLPNPELMVLGEER